MRRIGAYQVTPAQTVEERKSQLRHILEAASSKNVEFLCLPEGFITGYYKDEKLARENSIEVESLAFHTWLAEFNYFNITVIIGFNERHQNDIFDSAAVIEAGKLLGVQRKHYLYHPYFTSGSDFSVLQSQGITFGVVICLDTIYFEPSRLLALQGATILFSPMCNIVPLLHPYAIRPSYYSHFVARAFENRCWLITADWIWPTDDISTCPGHTVIYDPNGQEIVRSQEMKEELLIVDIPEEELFSDKGLRVKGSSILKHKLYSFHIS